MNNSNAFRLLAILKILNDHSREDHPLSAFDVMDYLIEEYGIKADRRTIYDAFRAIEDAGYNIVSAQRGSRFLDGNPFIFQEAKLLSDAVNSLSFLSYGEKRQLNDKIASSLDMDTRKRLKPYLISKSNQHSKPFYLLNDIYECIDRNQTLMLTIEKDRQEEVIPYTCFMNNGYYYLVYQYPEKAKLYQRRMDRISKVDVGRDRFQGREEVIKKDISEKDLQKHLSSIVNGFSGNKVRLTLDLLDLSEDNQNNIYDILSTDFVYVHKGKGCIYIDANESANSYANIFKLANRVRIREKDEPSRRCIENYKKYLSDTLKNYK